MDEHGNVIEEGASHYTTVPPSPSEIIYYDKARSAGRNTVGEVRGLPILGNIRLIGNSLSPQRKTFRASSSG